MNLEAYNLRRLEMITIKFLFEKHPEKRMVEKARMLGISARSLRTKLNTYRRNGEKWPPKPNQGKGRPVSTRETQPIKPKEGQGDTFCPWCGGITRTPKHGGYCCEHHEVLGKRFKAYEANSEFWNPGGWQDFRYEHKPSATRDAI